MEQIKEKVHIINKKYKIVSYIKKLDSNNSYSIEVGKGNNNIVPKPKEKMYTMKIINNGGLNLKVRYTRDKSDLNSRGSKFVELNNNENYNGIEIVITGPESKEQSMNIANQWLGILQSFFIDNEDNI